MSVMLSLCDEFCAVRRENFGEIDILINNAWPSRAPAPFLKTDEALWQRDVGGQC